MLALGFYQEIFIELGLLAGFVYALYTQTRQYWGIDEFENYINGKNCDYMNY